MKKISERQKAYILAHINDRPRTRLAKEICVSLTSLYRLVHENGGEIDHTMSTADMKAVEIIKTEFPHKSMQEIADAHGFSKSLVYRWAKKLNLSHTEEAQRRIDEKVRTAMLGRCPVDSYAVGMEKRRRKRKMDVLRVMSGMPQQTGYRIRILPVRTQKAIWALCKRGYIKTSKNSVKILYDIDTQRTPNEQLYTRKYGIQFMPNQESISNP